MKKLELNQIENLSGGKECGSTAEQFIATAGLVAGVASMFGPIGALIAGPTAIGMGIAALYCAYA